MQHGHGITRSLQNTSMAWQHALLQSCTFYNRQHPPSTHTHTAGYILVVIAWVNTTVVWQPHSTFPHQQECIWRSIALPPCIKPRFTPRQLPKPLLLWRRNADGTAYIRTPHTCTFPTCSTISFGLMGTSESAACKQNRVYVCVCAHVYYEGVYKGVS